MASENTTQQFAQLCTDCRLLFTEIEDVIHGNDDLSDVPRLFSRSFKSKHEISVSSESGCEICRHLVYNWPRYLDEDTTLTVQVNTTSGRDVEFCYHENEPDSEIEPGQGIWGFWVQCLGVDDCIPQPIGSGTGSDLAFDWVRRALDLCDSDHECMKYSSINRDPGKMPARILEVDERADGVVNVRMILSQELSSTEVKYLTLSHCWGDQVPLRLTHDTFDQFRVSIPWSELPLTFREAAHVALELGIPYLWIDSLCIIQDSEQDWEVQAATMAAVYSNAYLNIAASDSWNSSGGLFRHRTYKSLPSFTVQSIDPNRTDEAYLCYGNTEFEDFQGAPLGQRAWVVQEAFLSPRVLHFAQRQLHWQCTAQRSLESLPPSVTLSRRETHATNVIYAGMVDVWRSKKNDKTIAVIYQLWDTLVLQYTRAELTYQSDKAFAIHALALTICTYLGLDPKSAYVNGIWRPRLIEGLLWASDVPMRSRGFQIDSGVSSWSWMSRHHAVDSRYQPWSTADPYWRPSHQKVIGEVLEAQGDCTLISPRSSPGGFVRLKCPMCRAILEIEPAWSGHSSPTGDEWHSLRIGSTWLDEQYMDVRPDPCDIFSQSRPPTLEVYLLLGRVATDVSRHGWDKSATAYLGDAYYGVGFYECLLLYPVDGRPASFRRIGYAAFGRIDHFMDVEKQIDARLAELDMLGILDAQFRSHDIPEDLYHSVDEDFMYEITLM